jgi:prevent-host-death family protein
VCVCRPSHGRPFPITEVVPARFIPCVDSNPPMWPHLGYCGHMREMGVRELKASLSETLRAVMRGEQVRVTVRGRPVADIVPAGAAGSDRVRELVADGRGDGASQ